MRILKVGDKKKVVCEKCQSFESATFLLRDVPFSDGLGTVKNVLVGVCDTCDSVAVLPHQSTPAVKNQLQKQRNSLESRVPAHMIDILNLASDYLGGSTDYTSTILKYYIHTLPKSKVSPKTMEKYLATDLAFGKADKRLSIKGKNITNDFELLKKKTGIMVKTDLLKSIVLKINDDLLVHERKRPINQLKTIIAAIA